jgi:hypothetical protein
MEQLRRLLQAVDDFQQRHHWLAFPVAVVKRYGEQAGQRAALLAYYGFFSLSSATRSARRSRAAGCGEGAWP